MNENNKKGTITHNNKTDLYLRLDLKNGKRDKKNTRKNIGVRE